MISCNDISWLDDVPPVEVRRVVEALYRVHRLITAITDLDTLLERIMEEGKQVARAEACSLMLYDPLTEELYFQVTQGETGDQQALKCKVRLKLGQGIAGATAATRQSINVQDVNQDERFYRTADEITQFTTRSLLAVPLVDRDTLIGVIEVVNKVGGGTFTDMDLHVMEMFSSLAASSIANAHLIEQNLRAERMAAIGQAVAGLSHYIKNIITGMVGSVELVDQGVQSRSISLLERSWPIFKRSVKRISLFVQDMLAYSKPREPGRELCYMKNLVDEVSQTFWGLLVKRNLELTTDLEEATAPVYLDSQGMFSCLLNLLTNAADAVPASSGKIHLKASISSSGDLVVEVSDNGHGVPDDHCLKVFDPFFSTKGSSGTGLGLAVTAKIIQEHGGKIAVERSSLGGALFRFTIPQATNRRKA